MLVDRDMFVRNTGSNEACLMRVFDEMYGAILFSAHTAETRSMAMQVAHPMNSREISEPVAAANNNSRQEIYNRLTSGFGENKKDSLFSSRKANLKNVSIYQSNAKANRMKKQFTSSVKIFTTPSVAPYHAVPSNSNRKLPVGIKLDKPLLIDAAEAKARKVVELVFYDRPKF